MSDRLPRKTKKALKKWPCYWRPREVRRELRYWRWFRACERAENIPPDGWIREQLRHRPAEHGTRGV